MKYKPYNLKDVKEASAQKKFNVISTFAGGGGSSTGYRLAGGDILCINEFVEEARKTYKENYPDTPIIPGDIKELTGKDFLEVANIKEGELDILDGSPPCSAFSMCGTLGKSGSKHSDGWGKTKKYSDGKIVENIEDLFFEYLRVAKDIKPKVIIGENVAGLLAGEAKFKLNEIVNTFEKIGYDVSYKVLDASYFGVPQRRNRVFFIGVREDVTEAIGLSFMNISGIFPQENKEVVTIGEAFDGLELDSEELKWCTDTWIKSAHYKDTASLMPDDPDKVLGGNDFHPKGWHFNVKKMSRHHPAPTITTNADVCHFIEKRRLTISEIKRIMGLPDDFIVTGSMSQKIERCGRMVPSLMMKALAESVYKNVIEPYNEWSKNHG
jgi:DNA (cytosine-5)-methyltransferase 1|tara:strand:- start:927 stop:2069 length:1143 start_codon:yes stop_codon:yes gene_type:complete